MADHYESEDVYDSTAARMREVAKNGCDFMGSANAVDIHLTSMSRD